ncbi:unnamed protein product [Merluccius merluccius]
MMCLGFSRAVWSHRSTSCRLDPGPPEPARNDPQLTHSSSSAPQLLLSTFSSSAPPQLLISRPADMDTWRLAVRLLLIWRCGVSLKSRTCSGVLVESSELKLFHQPADGFPDFVESSVCLCEGQESFMEVLPAEVLPAEVLPAEVQIFAGRSAVRWASLWSFL